MSKSLVETKIVNLVELYCREYAVRLGYDYQDRPNEIALMARFLDKKIAKGQFRTGGRVNNNPVILNLLGGLKLYWRQVFPILRGDPVKGSAFGEFFKETYTRVMLHLACNGTVSMDEVVIRIALLGETRTLTLADLDEFYYEFYR